MRAGTKFKAIVLLMLIAATGAVAQDEPEVVLEHWRDAQYQQMKDMWDVRLQLIRVKIDMDGVILDDIQQQHLRGIKKPPTNPVKCLTDNIYYEAATEPFDGKVAVAQVTMNRVADSLGGDTVCQVVYFKKRSPETGKLQAAFSWTLGWHWRSHHMYRQTYQECERIARMVLAGKLHSDIIGPGVEFYHADYIRASWASDHQEVAQIGHHIFYE